MTFTKIPPSDAGYQKEYV